MIVTDDDQQVEIAVFTHCAGGLGAEQDDLFWLNVFDNTVANGGDQGRCYLLRATVDAIKIELWLNSRHECSKDCA